MNDFVLELRPPPAVRSRKLELVMDSLTRNAPGALATSTSAAPAKLAGWGTGARTTTRALVGARRPSRMKIGRSPHRSRQWTEASRSPYAAPVVHLGMVPVADAGRSVTLCDTRSF